ncbi:coenzyme F420-reducing hydrogenase, FrhD protein [Methanothermococcus sp. SCGC AD-155-E23]|nr:coenzyme F420-reducing hydrogenase, FrhD protein [Methanothermococcus sp. SCGC AD-155-E23]
MLPEYLRKEVLVIGCGNILFGDDGFGYHVVKRLEDMDLPDEVGVIDGGAGSAYYILSLLDEESPVKKIVVVDTIDFNLPPGTLVKLGVEDLPKVEKYNFDAHDVPLAPYLIEAHRRGIEVVIIGCQGKEITCPEIKMELSKEVEASIERAVKMVLEEIEKR